MFSPKLEILPVAQRLVWNELSQAPRSFVLYGGTAIALRLGHRESIDFDFFSNEPFEPSELLRRLGSLREARIDQRGDNTLSLLVDRTGPVKLSFFGGIRMDRIHNPDIAEDNGLQIASLLDLTATKLNTIQQRAEAKDYRDIAAALKTGLDLAEALGAAVAVFGRTFNAMTALKALTYFGDGNLPTLSEDVRHYLQASAEAVKLEALPLVVAKAGIMQAGVEK